MVFTILILSLQAMFTCGLRETRGGEVPLRDTPAQSLELLLGYMYRAQLPLSHDNTQGVAAAAFLLHIDGAFRWVQVATVSHDTTNTITTLWSLLQVVSELHVGQHGYFQLCRTVPLGQRPGGR